MEYSVSTKEHGVDQCQTHVWQKSVGKTATTIPFSFKQIELTDVQKIWG